VDYGFVGDIDAVDADVLRRSSTTAWCRWSARCRPMNGTLLNINADTVAAALAAALGARS
jgi:acetylglutamate kinase